MCDSLDIADGLADAVLAVELLGVPVEAGDVAAPAAQQEVPPVAAVVEPVGPIVRQGQVEGLQEEGAGWDEGGRKFKKGRRGPW